MRTRTFRDRSLLENDIVDSSENERGIVVVVAHTKSRAGTKQKKRAMWGIQVGSDILNP
jgi:hypothetical protein